MSKEFDYNFHENRVFANKLNGINLQELEQTEREKLLIKEKIYIRSDRKPLDFILKKYEKEGKLLTALYDVNPDLKKEIVKDFYNGTSQRSDIFAYCKRLENNLENALHKQHKVEIVEKQYKKILKKLNKLEQYYWTILSDKELEEYGCSNFDEYIFSEISTDFLYEYITNEFASYSHNKLFRELIIIKELEDKLKFCKTTLINIENDLETKGKREPSKYPDIFPNKKCETFFFNFLKTYRCLDENNKPVAGIFQTHCDAYYEEIKISEHKKGEKLLIRGRVKNKFIDMLNLEFKQTITKLSKGDNKRDVTENYIKNLFENNWNKIEQL